MITKMALRPVILAAVGAVVVTGFGTIAGTQVAAAAEAGIMWRTPSCGCCEAWARHMGASGFNLAIKDLPRSQLDAKKSVLGVAGKFAGCHTAQIGNYVIEGHVPAADVARLLAEKPDAVGLSVPGMPAGSPGMETGGAPDAYDVLLMRKDGSSEVYSHHGDAGTPLAPSN